jgi:hypothetical protein
MRRAHDPSGLCRRGPRLRRHPQQQAGRPRGLCGQGQLAAGNQIELLRLTPDLQHDGADRIADQCVSGRPQRMIHVRGANGDQKPRIKTKLGKPAHRDGARFNLGEILTDPHHGPPHGYAADKPRDKAGRRGALPPGTRKHLVNGAQSEPALQVCVCLFMSERHLAQTMRRIMRLDAFDAAT